MYYKGSYNKMQKCIGAKLLTTNQSTDCSSETRRHEVGIVRTCSLKEALQEIDAGRPVAMRFDRYFSLQWRDKKSTFAYHWVPLIGYEIKNDELWLIFHDNGGPQRDSQIRQALYKDNEKVLSFVKMVPY